MKCDNFTSKLSLNSSTVITTHHKTEMSNFNSDTKEGEQKIKRKRKRKRNIHIYIYIYIWIGLWSVVIDEWAHV